MIAEIIAKIFGTSSSRQIRKLQPIVDKINALEDTFKDYQDHQFTSKTNEFKEKISQGESLDNILPEAFALVREAAKRKINQRHYDVQIIGGIILHQGKIAEMKTGEGKTLTATLPLYLNALSSKGAHLVTVNEYLAKRDAEWMSLIYNYLGLSVGVLQNHLNDRQRKEEYQKDILYATNNELGFDYLRDNMKFRLEDYVQRGFNYAIVDEVDSILIDEARTPLIISGSSDESSKLYIEANKVVSSLSKNDYEIDEKEKNIILTEQGIDKVEKAFKIKNLYAVDNINVLHHINQALKAHHLFKRDIQYVVRDGEVLIVDEFTGRILPGRRYNDGLHQAIEAKENVKIERESQTLASITLQNYFRLYTKLAGMTGTALTEAEEFYKIYKLDVVSIPTNKPMIRQDHSDIIFVNKNAKYKYIINDIRERYKKGQPILIGTISIESSEYLSLILKSENIPHEVLNAKNHAREAEIIAKAGEAGHVTIATNMAGRGTDIKLTKESKDAGGLYILGTERHESRRIDNQLRGRSGRQGDPGESRFYISFEDDLIRRFAGDNIKNSMERFKISEDDILEGKFVSQIIEKAQERIEKQNFEIRKHLLEYDDVLNQQRTIIYTLRKQILESSKNILELIKQILQYIIDDIIIKVMPNNISKEGIKEVIDKLSKITNYNFDNHIDNLLLSRNFEYLAESLVKILIEKYEDDLNKAKENDQYDILKEAHKWVMLQTIDQAWKQHMLNLDNLKEGIGLRGWGQKNPLIEYKREAFEMFEDLMRQVQTEIIQLIFNLNTSEFNKHELEHQRQLELDSINLIGPADLEGSLSEIDVQQNQAISSKIGRNEECQCGSGKKYKKCCLNKK